MTPEEAIILSDAIKIGLPALIGLMAGLIPYLIERKKLSIQKEINECNKKSEIAWALVESFSKFSGSASEYLSILLSRKLNLEGEWHERLEKAGNNMLSLESEIMKAKALAGITGNKELLDAFIQYDKMISRAIGVFVRKLKLPDEEVQEILDSIHTSERNLLNSMHVLL